MSLEAGLKADLEHVVGSADTAVSMGSGAVEVLATPRVLAWVEAACMAAIAGHLGAGETSVGMRAQLDHVHASVVGTVVSSSAELERVDGRRLTFVVTATDGNGQVIATGRLIRVVVDTARFLDKANA